MKVLGEPFVSFGDKAMATRRAPVFSRPTFDNPSLHPTWRDHYVKRPLYSRVCDVDPFTLRYFDQISAAAGRTLRVGDLKPLTHPDSPIPVYADDATMLFECLAGGGEKPLPLVVKISAVVHEL